MRPRPPRLVTLALLLTLVAAVGAIRLLRSRAVQEYRLGGMSAAELRDWTERHPGDALGHDYLGRAHERSGETREAAREYATALDLDPTLTRVRPPLAALLVAGGQERAAESLLAQGVQLDPAVPALHAGLARIYERRGEFRRAAAEWELTTSLEPNDAGAWFRLGECWMRLNDEARALRPYQQAVELAPLTAAHQRALAGVLRLQGRYADAERHCRRALRLRPDDPEAHFELAKLLRDRDGATPQAAESLRRAVALRSDDPLLRYFLAAVYQEEGNRQPAVAEYRAALRLLHAHRPSAGADWEDRSLWFSYLEGAHFNLAALLQRCGQPAAAARHRAEFRRISEHHRRVQQSLSRESARR